MRHQLFSRRSLLRGACAALALPALVPGRAQAAPPKRFVVYHVPEGVPVGDGSIFARTPDYWWPNADLSMLPKATAPLAKHRERLLFVKGIGFDSPGDRHEQGMSELLTGNLDGPARTTSGGVNVPPGMSIDQILAHSLSKGTPYRSYGVGILNHLEGVARKRRVSYSSANGGRDPINDPLKVFDDLLANVSGEAGMAALEARRRSLVARKSVLDSLKNDITTARCAVGQDGRTKLDAYLNSVREIETRIADQLKAPAPPPSALKPTRPTREGARDYWGNKNNAPALGEIQMRNAAQALAADVTRVLVFQWNQSVSRQTYPWLAVSDKGKEGHGFAHATALDSGQATRWAADRAVIFEWYSKQFARFLDLLAEIPEEGGTVLDNTMVLYCSEMSQGHHGGSNLPFILAGSAGRSFKQGRLIDARANGRHRWVNDLLTGILRGYGVGLDQIGRANRNGGPYTEILA
jgi:hypothetical protein